MNLNYNPWKIKFSSSSSSQSSSSLSLSLRAQKMCESRGGRPRLPVPNSPQGLYGRKATLNSNGYTADAYQSLVAVHCSVKLAQVMVGTLLAKIKSLVATDCSVKLAQPQVLPITTAITAFLEKFRKTHGMEPVSYTHLTCRRQQVCRSRWSPYH